MHRRDHWLAAALVVVGLGLAGCGTGSAQYGEISQGGPVRLEPIKGTELSRVSLTTQAADRLGVKTQAIAEAPTPEVADAAPAPAATTVPVAALIYDKDGATWVYTVAGARTYERHPVTVSRIDGGTVVLSSGPPAGTEVVTVGASELLGAELGVAGE